MKNIESKFNEAFKKGNVYRPLDWSVFNNYFPSLNGYALDFGAGRGDSSLFLAKLGLKVDAIDFSKEAFKQRIKHKNINYILGSNIPDKKYDFILLKHVIAFIKDKKKFIEILKSHLKKNGKLLIVTPVKRKNYNMHQKLISVSAKLFDDSFELLHREYGGNLEVRYYNYKKL